MLLLRGLVLPAVRVMTGDIEAAGPGSLIAHGLSKVLRWGGAAGVAAAPIDGWIQVSVHNPRAASLVVPIALVAGGGIALGGGYVLKRVSENLMARWHFTVECASKMRLGSMYPAVLRITSADEHQSNQVRAEFKVVGLAFHKEPEQDTIRLTSDSHKREIEIMPTQAGLNKLGIRFNNLDTDEVIGNGRASIYVYKAKIAGLIIPNDWYDRASATSRFMIWVGGISTFVDLATKVAARVGL